MSLRELLATMEREAAAQAEDIRRKAAARAEAMTAEVRARLGDRREDAVEVRAAELRQESNRILAAARRKARARVLQLQQETLERIHHEAQRKLPALEADSSHRLLLPPTLARARQYLGQGPVHVRISPALKSIIAGNGDPTLGITPDPAIGSGFTVTNADGSVTVDETLERRLEAMWPSLSIELARLLEQ